MSLKLPVIIFLPGVYKSDCKSLNDIEDEKWIMQLAETQETADSVAAAEPQESLPAFFTTPDKWPKKSALRCSTCRGTCTTYPKIIIQSIGREKDGSYKCQHMGLPFDTYPCAAHYIKYYLENSHELRLHLRFFYTQMEGKSRYGDIVPARSLLLLTDYNGPVERAAWISGNQLADDESEAFLKAPTISAQGAGGDMSHVPSQSTRDPYDDDDSVQPDQSSGGYHEDEFVL